MNGIFQAVNDALGGAWPLAVAASLLWGVVSVLLSPCHLGTIALVVGFVSRSAGTESKGRGGWFSFSFALGMLLAIALVGALAVGAGVALAGVATYTNYGIAVVFLAAGLVLLGILPLPTSGLNPARFKAKGLGAAFLMGLVFGIGLSPCTFAFVAPILGIAMGAAARSPAFGYLLLLVFGVGHCGVIGLAGGSAELVQRYLNWNSKSKGLAAVKVVCGVCLILGASFLAYSA